MDEDRAGKRKGGLQPTADLESWWEDPDPWQYEGTPDDARRRAALLSLLPGRSYRRALDIGCGNGFITTRLPAEETIGIDISHNAIRHARRSSPPHVTYRCCSLFDLPRREWAQAFDLVVITGVLYPQYIARSARLVYLLVDGVMEKGGILASCHIEEWYACRFPFTTLVRDYYSYRDYVHLIEVYRK